MIELFISLERGYCGMREITCPFHDEGLICDKSFEPINFTLARVETKTFIQMLNDRVRVVPGPKLRFFFDCYDDAMAKIAEVDEKMKDPKTLINRISKITNIKNLSESEIEKLKLKQLNELGKREECIRRVLDKLQKNLFDAVMKDNFYDFEVLLKEGAVELNIKVDYLYELISEAD